MRAGIRLRSWVLGLTWALALACMAGCELNPQPEVPGADESAGGAAGASGDPEQRPELGSIAPSASDRESAKDSNFGGGTPAPHADEDPERPVPEEPGSTADAGDQEADAGERYDAGAPPVVTM